MEIIITKGKNRNTLTCKRADGSATSVNLGPDIPNHDIAHYVVEKIVNLENGFYGNIKSGMTLDELSDKDIIKTLDSEAWLSEIMTRNLQSIGSGAVKTEEYIGLIRWEIENSKKGINIPNIDLTDVKKMKAEFNLLCKKWSSIPENETLTLIFS